MNYDLLFAIILYALIFIFFLANKKKFKVQGKIILMYPTKVGISLMDRVSKISPKTLKVMGYAATVIGFLGMIFIFYTLAGGAIKVFAVPKAAPTLAPVLPGIKIPGAPALSFWHWIIAILITATVHEFSHGVIARLFQIKIKSSGFALFGPILAAFVEPEEEELRKLETRKQLAIFSAGPFSNILLGILFFFLFIFLTGPIVASNMEPKGIVVNEVMEGYPAEEAGMKAPFTILKINGSETLSIENFTKTTSEISPNQEIVIETDKGSYLVKTTKNPQNKTKGFIGIGGFEEKVELKRSSAEEWGTGTFKTLIWINMLIIWLFIINVGIGLFNLLPLGPVDGGRMMYAAAGKILKDESKARKLWGAISLICLILILINLLPWLSKLVSFLTGLV